MKKLLLTLVVSSIASVSMAAGDAEAGKSKTAVCASCHGVDGISIVPSYPNLAGQKFDYLVATLNGYKSKERTGLQAATMYAMVAPLSREDIDDIAAYYSEME